MVDQKETNVAYNARISELRRSEYPMLNGETYLDHAGTTLPPASLTAAFSNALQNTLLANPHSASSSVPSLSLNLVTETRNRVLSFFDADPEHFDVAFVANATAGIKLVSEAFAGHKEGFRYLYSGEAHTSIVGIRQLAKSSQCFADDDEVEQWIQGGSTTSSTRSDKNDLTLFAYPAQSNLTGRRLPLTYAGQIRNSPQHHKNTYTLLDIAAYATTAKFSLHDPATAPDFTVLSFYKIFGFPDLGALILRKDSAHIFETRRYFGGGTTEMITCFPTLPASEVAPPLPPSNELSPSAPWRILKQAHPHSRLEDGTLPIHSILALSHALTIFPRLYKSISHVSIHTTSLANQLYTTMTSLKYPNGQPLCTIYKSPHSQYGDAKTQGATIPFNLHSPTGEFYASSTIFQLAATHTPKIYIRTGSMCNPAGMSRILGIEPWEMKRAFEEGFRCGQTGDVRGGRAWGICRVSFGAASTVEDCLAFEGFLRKRFLEGGDGDGLVVQGDGNGDGKSKYEGGDLGARAEGSTATESSFEKPGKKSFGGKRSLSGLLKLCMPSGSKKKDQSGNKEAQ